VSVPDIAGWIVMPFTWAAGLFLPGYFLQRCWRSPAPVVAAFLGSGLVLFYLVVGLDALHIPLDRWRLGAALTGVDLLLWWLARHAASRQPSPKRTTPSARERFSLWPWGPPVLLTCCAVVGRALVDPLSGWDNIFRWDFLSRQLLHTGTLAFYPPVSAEDFWQYGWCDGIPPLVSILNFWIYLCAPRADAWLIAARIGMETGLLFLLVGRLSNRLWGAGAAAPARAALGTSALLLWGLAMGQETGLITVTLVAMWYFLEEHAKEPDSGSLVWAALAAAAGALTREYGLCYLGFGVGLLAWHHRPVAEWLRFTLVATAVALPWYARNAWRTGNPLFSHDFFGLFPTNAAYTRWMHATAEYLSLGHNMALLGFGAAFLTLLAGLLFVLGAWGAVGARRASVPLVAVMLLVTAFWLWSIHQTAGGLVYSARVLTPALALAAALAGRALSGLTTTRRRLFAVVLTLAAGDAAVRSFYLPDSPFVLPAEFSLEGWRKDGRKLASIYRRPSWDILATEARGRGIIVDHPVYHALLVARGAHAVPLMSPQAAAVFAPNLGFNEASARLRAAGVRFIVYTPATPVNQNFAAQTPYLQTLLTVHPPTVRVGGQVIYDLNLLP
jgi:hypothetical protein